MDRKQAILKAASHLFAERGFASTSTSAIAKKAGVAEGLIFHYFKTKQGIIINILKEMLEQYIAEFEQTAQQELIGLQAIKKLISFHFQFGENNHEALLIVIRDFPHDLMAPGSPTRVILEDRSSHIINILKECIERGINDRSIRDLPAAKTAFIIHGLLHGISRLKMLGNMVLPDLSKEVVKFCHRSLDGFLATNNKPE